MNEMLIEGVVLVILVGGVISWRARTARARRELAMTSDALPDPAAARVERQRVTITDVDIPFERLMAIALKGALAAIPAAILLSLIVGVFRLFFGALFAAGR